MGNERNIYVLLHCRKQNSVTMRIVIGIKDAERSASKKASSLSKASAPWPDSCVRLLSAFHAPGRSDTPVGSRGGRRFVGRPSLLATELVLKEQSWHALPGFAMGDQLARQGLPFRVVRLVLVSSLRQAVSGGLLLRSHVLAEACVGAIVI